MSDNMMSRSWWMWILRGVFAILFGVVAIIVPNITLTVLVWMFGAYVILDGGFNIYYAIETRDVHTHWWFGLVEGIAGIIVGLAAFILPGMTGLILLYLIAFWALATGFAEILAAIQLRKKIKNEVFLALGGVLSIIFGMLLIASPGNGALAVVWTIGIYAMIFGGMMIGHGLHLYRSSDSTPETDASHDYHHSDSVRGTV